MKVLIIHWRACQVVSDHIQHCCDTARPAIGLFDNMIGWDFEPYRLASTVNGHPVMTGDQYLDVLTRKLLQVAIDKLWKPISYGMKG